MDKGAIGGGLVAGVIVFVVGAMVLKQKRQYALSGCGCGPKRRRRRRK